MKDWSNVRNRWPGRLRRVAAHVPEGSSVIDLGAGARGLRDVLPDGCVYTPADLYPRTPDTVVFDADTEIWPEGEWDVAVMAGLLEHCRRPRHVIEQACNIAGLVIATYLHDPRPSWPNPQTRRQVESAFPRPVVTYPMRNPKWVVYVA